MSEISLGRVTDTPRENRQQKKKRLIREIRGSQDPANLVPSICKIAELFMLDPDEKIALKMLRKSLAKNAEGVFKACVSLLNDGKAAHCAVICTNVVKHSVKEKSFLNLLGAAIEKQGRIEEAIAVFTLAIEVDLHWPVARCNRGKARLSLGLVEESVKDFNHVLNAHPRDEAALLNRASAMIRLGQRESALSDLDRLLMLNQRSVEALVNKAILLLEMHQIEELNETLQQLGVLAPENPQHIRIKFELAMQQGRFDQAYKHAAAGKALFPNDMQFTYAMAVVETELNEDASALKRVEILLRQQNHQLGVKPLLLGARLFSKANCPAEAEKLLLDAYRQDRQNVHTNYALGNHYRRLRQWENALKHYRLSESNGISSGFVLEALYVLGRKQEYLQRHNELLSLGKSTVVAGAVAGHAEVEYGLELGNPFCPHPMQFIFSRALEEDSTFILDALEAIGSDRRFRPQTLLTNGDQTLGHLFLENQSVRQRLEKIIRREVRHYCEVFKRIDSPYFRVLRTNELTINAWAITIRSNGFLSSHIHERGWMSGTIYLQVPAKESGNEGDIVFSTHGKDYPGEVTEHQEKVIEVKAGMINLFPASLFHRTLPFVATDCDRVCIAFDVFPIYLDGRTYVGTEY